MASSAWLYLLSCPCVWCWVAISKERTNNCTPGLNMKVLLWCLIMIYVESRLALDTNEYQSFIKPPLPVFGMSGLHMIWLELGKWYVPPVELSSLYSEEGFFFPARPSDQKLKLWVIGRMYGNLRDYIVTYVKVSSLFLGIFLKSTRIRAFTVSVHASSGKDSVVMLVGRSLSFPSPKPRLFGRVFNTIDFVYLNPAPEEVKRFSSNFHSMAWWGISKSTQRYSLGSTMAFHVADTRARLHRSAREH